eukprot:365312-Chlamydomonas_euryale.AAC.15
MLPVEQRKLNQTHHVFFCREHSVPQSKESSEHQQAPSWEKRPWPHIPHLWRCHRRRRCSAQLSEVERRADQALEKCWQVAEAAAAAAGRAGDAGTAASEALSRCAASELGLQSVQVAVAELSEVGVGCGAMGEVTHAPGSEA